MRLQGLPTLVFVRNLAAVQMLAAVAWTVLVLSFALQRRPSLLAALAGVALAWLARAWWALADETLLRHDVTLPPPLDRPIPLWSFAGVVALVGLARLPSTRLGPILAWVAVVAAVVAEIFATAPAVSIWKQCRYNINRRRFFLGNWQAARADLGDFESTALVRINQFITSQSGDLTQMAASVSGLLATDYPKGRPQLLAAAMAAAPLRAYEFVGIGSKPFHDLHEHPWIAELMMHFPRIRQEIVEALACKPALELYPLLGLDVWKSLPFYKGGVRIADGCDLCPFTAELVERLVPGGPVREVMVSQLEPHGRLLPHIDNTLPMLTLHVPLIAPQPSGIRVGNEVRRWQEGGPVIIDTTYEHEAWNDSDEPRINLMIDFWPNGLSETEKEFFTNVYRRQMRAHQKG